MNLIAYGKASFCRCLPTPGARSGWPKIWMTMKLTIILLTIACLNAGAKTAAQTVTIREKNVSLEKVFKEITRQTGYAFFLCRRFA